MLNFGSDDSACVDYNLGIRNGNNIATYCLSRSLLCFVKFVRIRVTFTILAIKIRIHMSRV